MAFPLIAALALAAGSAYANNRAADAQQAARRQANQAQLARQRQLQMEADALNENVQERFQRDNVEEQMQELAGQEEARAVEAIEEGGEQFSPTDALSDDTPAVIRESGEKAKAKSLAEAMRNARSLSALQGYGLAGFENDIALNRNATNLNQINDFARGNQSIFRAELDDAQNAGSGWSSLGQILGAASTAAGAYGAFGGAGALAGNPTAYSGALGNAATAATQATPSLASWLQSSGSQYLQPLLAQRR
ncbi:hypothetical protein DFO67_1323 [Modicisalibacter xianhensis]|uniref:Uncharacterized protein n=1 Tax=Modicisalibacter xianhensis TaxID=442341 RepID=A0A4R8F8F3_9GAMM|nr:hypothetical protein [Halomonas xianhensis]TDX21884.1 hypothetical protein DFO67_1323 [Halomonas xianhensis]